jgi:cytochrome bd-type quinol oxidase subunit 2
MKKADWQYLVDVLLFVCLGGMTLIGILLGLVIPTGHVSFESSKYFLGLHRHQWGNIHAYLSIAFVVLIIIHLVLSWKWVTAKTSQIFKKRAVPILVSTACVPFLVVLLFWLFMPKDAEKYKEYGIASSGGRHAQQMVAEETAPVAAETAGPLAITGRHTLLDIERATGVSGRAIADRLGLPPSAPLNETLGRLKQRYGFEIQAVRDIVERMLKK